MAATKDRDLQERAGAVRSFPLAAATKIFAGTIACVDASGNLTKGATATTLKAVGVTKQQYDNSAGLAGDMAGDVYTGVFGPFANSASGDLIADADVNANCYIVDDVTVAKTDGTGSRSVAGRVFKVDTAGVWVKFY